MVLKISVFLESAILNDIFTKQSLLHSHENQSKFLGKQGWVEILIITLVSSQKLHTPNISAPAPLCTYLRLERHFAPNDHSQYFEQPRSIMLQKCRKTFHVFCHTSFNDFFSCILGLMVRAHFHPLLRFLPKNNK